MSTLFSILTGPGNGASAGDAQDSPERFDRVTFLPYGGGTRIFLTLESAWKRRCGLAPDLNQAAVPWTEMQKLGQNLDLTGTIEFWYQTDPAAANAVPDVRLMGERLIDCEPREAREVAGVGVIVPEYRLSFADFREGYVSPRGGRVAIGEANAGEKPPQQSLGSAPTPPDPMAVPEKTTTELIQACLDKMNLGGVAIPAAAGSIEAPRNIKWFGNHAPTELHKLLDLCGIVFVPGLNGMATLAQMTSDGTPQLPAGEVLPEMKVSAADRRGKVVIFSSYPSRTIVTGDDDGPDPGTWFFVVQDRFDEWVSIDACNLLPGGPASHIADNFARVPLKYQERIRAQVYRFIQANQDMPAGAAPILNDRFEANGRSYPISVTASVAVQDRSTGRWGNTAGPIEIAVKFRLDPDILQLDRPLITVTGPTYDALGSYGGPANFTVRSSYEDAEQQGQAGDWLPKYFHAGFSRTGAAGGIDTLADGDVENAIDGATKDAIILTRPELRLFRVDDQEVNKDALTSAAKSQAAQFLKEASKPNRILATRGFTSIAPSGLVSEVEWDQKSLKTTLKLCDWYVPSGALEIRGELRKLEAGGPGAGGGAGDGGGSGGGISAGGDRYPNQTAMQSERAAQGESGAAMRIDPIAPLDPPTWPGVQVSIVKVNTATNMGGLYGILEVTGNPTGLEAGIDSTAQAGTRIMMPQGMTIDPADRPGEMMCFDEDGLKGHRLSVNSYAVVLRRGSLDKKHQGAPVYVMLAGVGSRTGAVTLGTQGGGDPASPDPTLPDPTSWSFDGDGKPVIVTMQSRTYMDTAAGILYGFSRNWLIDALGKTYQISGETQYIIDSPVPCTTR
jgi:hypothetical protein